MDLSCSERMDMGASGSEGPSSPKQKPPSMIYAPRDPTLSSDSRVLPNMIISEKFCLPTCDYFKHVQDDVQPYMRKVVTTWMLEVCEEQTCEDGVFPLAVNYVDRFLCTRRTSRLQLQLLASAALLLASKLHGAPLPVPLLCAYTDNSITPQELRCWELLLLQQLGWRTSALTALDFVEHVCHRSLWSHAGSLMRRHANTLAAFCYTESDFMLVPPSQLSAACLMSAARGLGAGVIIPGQDGAPDMAIDALASVCALTSTCPEVIEGLVRQVDHLVARESAPPKSAYSTSSVDPPGTPTDVQDVSF